MFKYFVKNEKNLVNISEINTVFLKYNTLIDFKLLNTNML